MKALRYYGKADIRIEDVPRPEAQAGEVLIAVEWCGVCGTDLTEYEFGPIVAPRADRPHPLTGGRIPVTLGQYVQATTSASEFCGRIVASSSGSGFEIGNAVMVDPRLNCTSCHRCKTNVEHLCTSWGFVGLSGNHGGGGFSEFVAVDARMCHLLPEDVRFDEAVLIEPLAVGRHALSMADFDDFTDKTVLVVGAGPIGLSVLWNLRAVGARTTIVSEPSAGRRERARGVADQLINPLEANVADECRKLTDGMGVQLAIDCAGVPAGMRSAMAALGVRGSYINVAGWKEPAVLPMEIMMIKELTVKSSMAYDNSDYKAVVADFISGKFKGVESMITSRIALDDLPKAFEALIHDKDHHVKVIATSKLQHLDHQG